MSFPAHAAFTISNNSGAAQVAANSAGTAVISLTGTVADDTIVVGCYWRGDTGVTITGAAIPAESALSSTTAVNDATNGHKMQFWYLESLSGSGSKTITVTYSGSVPGECVGASLSSGSGGVLDDSDGATGNSTTATVDLQSTAANDAIFAIVTGGPTTPTLGGGYTRVVFNDAWFYAEGEYLLDASTSGTETVSMTVDNAAWSIAAVAFKIDGGGGSPTREQEGFRWGVDDGNEAAHTFEAAQDTNISIADTQSRLLRALVNGTGDPATAAYTLRSQKNGAGGYVVVPVGSTTAGAGISNQVVAASADDSQDINGTNTINGTTIGGSLDATTDWAGMRFTNIAIPVGATITAATVGVVPSATTEDEPLVTVYFEAADDCAAFTTGASNISGRSRTTGVSWSSADLAATGATYHDTPSLVSDLQAVINRAGWASGNDVCVLIQGGATSTRDLTIEAQDLGPNTNPPRLSVSWTTPNEIYISTSANIAAGGEATTARLTAPSGKTTSDFVTGRRWDDENGSDSIDITTDDYTEVEWRVTLSATPAASDYFEFRVYAGSSALDTYTLTPRWSIPGAATAVTIISQVNL